MIKANFNTYNNYITDSLYQWDLNQYLIINGLNLSVAPEIHFANSNMDRAIVRQSTLEKGAVTVGIPNSLLQEALIIKAYVGVYEGTTFTIIETIEIPVIAKARPSDYALTDTDEEIYSFDRLENEIANMVTIKDFEDDKKVIDARISNIIAHNNDTEGNTELLDIRTGADGTIYTSAGEAVRGQVSQLSSEIANVNNNVDDLGLTVVKNCVTKIDRGHYWDNYGNLLENSGYDSVTIEVEGNKTYSSNKAIGGNYFNIFTDENGNVLEPFTSDKALQIGNGYYFVTPANAKYVKSTSGLTTYWDNFIVLEGKADISNYNISDYPINTIVSLKSALPLELSNGTRLNECDNRKIFYCGATRDYTKLKEVIEEATKYMDSTVYVDEGVYDLVEEFGTSYLDAYNGTDNIGLLLKNRVKVIFSSGAKVVFDYQGTNGKVHEYFAPFNSGVHGFALENAYVESKNCRYSVHDERAHDTDSYHNIYKRCTFIHDSSNASGWHASQAIGGGLGKYGDILIEDCYCKSVSNDDTISYHSTTIAEDGNNAKSKIVVKNTYTSGTLCFIPLGNSTEKTPILVSGCNLRIEPKLDGTTETMELISWGNTIRSQS